MVSGFPQTDFAAVCSVKIGRPAELLTLELTVRSAQNDGAPVQNHSRGAEESGRERYEVPPTLSVPKGWFSSALNLVVDLDNFLQPI